jgi:hypothetical protein
LLLGETLCGVTQRIIDIFFSDAILICDSLDGHARRHPANEHIDRHARAANDRVSGADGWIDDDPGCKFDHFLFHVPILLFFKRLVNQPARRQTSIRCPEAAQYGCLQLAYHNFAAEQHTAPNVRMILVEGAWGGSPALVSCQVFFALTNVTLWLIDTYDAPQASTLPASQLRTDRKSVRLIRCL